MERVLQHSSSFGTHCSRIRSWSSRNSSHRNSSCCEHSSRRNRNRRWSSQCCLCGSRKIGEAREHQTDGRSSLNTVNDLVSKALEDEQVSNEDFHDILREMENYRAHKAGIKHRTRADLIKLRTDRERKIREEAEQAGLEQGKKK